MSERYYTPTDKDLRIGFECEVYSEISGTWDYNMFESNGMLFHMRIIPMKYFRVPYLTKEQIEQIGFQDVKLNAYNNSIEFTNFHPDEMYKDVRGHALFILTNDDRHMLFISKKDGTSNSNGPNLIQVYAGRCRCKNDLLMIMELCHVRSNINTPTTILELKKHPLTPYE